MNIPGFHGIATIARCLMPANFSDVVGNALRNKLPKLIKTIADRRILLIERDQPALGEGKIIQEILKLAPQYPEIRNVHEIWIVSTCALLSESYVSYRRFDSDSRVKETMLFKHGKLLQT